MPIIPTFKKLRYKDHKFEAGPSYIVVSEPLWVTKIDQCERIQLKNSEVIRYVDQRNILFLHTHAIHLEGKFILKPIHFLHDVET